MLLRIQGVMYVLTVHACISFEQHLPFQPIEVNILQGDSYQKNVINVKFSEKKTCYILAYLKQHVM